MAYCLLLTVVFVLFSDVNSQSNTKCASLSPETNFQEPQCVATKTWYLYASSKPCENCCIKRTLSTSSPNTLEITEHIQNGTSPTTATFTVAKMRADPKYDIGGGHFYHVLAGTDCVKSAVVYNTQDDQLFVFSHKKDPGQNFLSTLKGVTQCDLKMYKYNPEVNCREM